MIYYKEDFREIRSILYSLYPKDNLRRSSKLALFKISEVGNEDFLNSKSAYLYEIIKSDPECENKLALFEEQFCTDKKCINCPLAKYCNSFIYSCRRNINVSNPVIIDLFCGAGGLSLGFKQAGYRILLANDIESSCIDTYMHNHPEIPSDSIFLGDIKKLVNGINDHFDVAKVDVIVGGPPCQGFSMANRQRLIDDPRNYLYKEYVRIVNNVKPKFFVMENVKGMLSVAHQVKEDFERTGYDVSFSVVNAKDFGVPQNRERLIFIGNCIGVDNNKVFDVIKNISNTSNKYVLNDALIGLRPLEASGVKNDTDNYSYNSGNIIELNLNQENSEYVSLINEGHRSIFTFNHKARYNNERDIEIFRRLNPGDRSDDPKIADIMPYARRNKIFKDKYYKLEGDKVCKTITAHMKFDCNMYIHPWQARGLTPREAARVQSYPDDYFFRGAFTKTYMQIGNSVPPLLSKALASAIKIFI